MLMRSLRSGSIASLRDARDFARARLFGALVSSVALSGCYPSYELPDASSGDGSWQPPLDAAPQTDSGVRRDATVGIDAGPAVPDATVIVDASAPDASLPPDGGSTCVLPDLIVELPEPRQAASYRTMDVTEDDCELFEGCVGGQGVRSLLELSFRLVNVGGEAITLGRPFENPLFYPSFCQESYVIDGLFQAELYAPDGSLAAGGRLSTSCIAGEDGGFSCRTQGLGAGEASEQPIGRCDFLDVTGLGAGPYRLKITANPDGVLSECDLDNNSAEVDIEYAPCAGTVCGGECCPEGVDCVQGVCMLPDLRISEQSAAESLWISHRTFDENSCELAEMCVGGGGRRRLLEFEGRIENWGPGDLRTGAEANNPLFEFSECHEHYHFRDFTDYRLLNADGSVAAQGHKQAFCLVSMVPLDTPTPAPGGVRPPPGDTGCNELRAGWADIYGVGTDCQWVDITDVEPGDYVLELAVNPLGRVVEADLDNNVVQIPVHIDEDVPCLPGQAEVCGDDIDQDCDDQRDDWDPDCQVCYPGDPFCEAVIPVAGNDSCAQPYDMTAQGTYVAVIEDHDPGEVMPSCGGGGGDVFFAFTLEREQVVYLGALGSEVDTVFALYRGDCDGEQLGCEDEACGMPSGQLVQVLPAGQYVVAVKAEQPGVTAAVRLKFEHADANGAIVLDAPGVYVGDTRDADDSVQASCPFFVPPPILDGGVPDVEACVESAVVQAGGLFTDECVQCACERDALSTVSCGPDCWALIDCIVDECAGDGADVACIVQQCQPFISGANAATSTGPVLRACPESCPLMLDGGVSGVDGGGVGIAGSAAPGPVVGGPAGGRGPIGPRPVPPDGGVPSTPIGRGGRDDIYVLSACQGGLIASTCGTADFASVLDMRRGGAQTRPLTCSEQSGYCASDPNGAVIESRYAQPGLTFLVIDGRNEDAAGEYQLSVIY